MEAICQNEAILPILNVFQKILSLIQLIVPILLIIFAMISLTRLVKNPEEKNGLKKIFNQFLAAAVIFLIPTIVNATMGMLGENTNISTCWEQAKSPSTTPTQYYEIDEREKQTFLQDVDDYEKGNPILAGACLSKNKTNKILFVGNSKTYVHNIPDKVKAMASNQGYSVSVTAVTRGGYTLSELANEFGSKITADSYDCVVLQEQTDVYMHNSNAYSSGAQRVISLVRGKNSSAKIYIRALWATSSTGSSTRENSYRVTESIASQNQASVIYDGKAFDNSRAKYPEINLFGDSIHQSEAGAYLSAAMIYKNLSGSSPSNITYTASLSSSTANKLLTIANNT